MFSRHQSSPSSYKSQPTLKAFVLLMGLTTFNLQAIEPSKVHLHGYADIHSNNDLDQERKLDLHRATLGLKAELAPQAFFNFELDFEHGFKEPEVEFAYLDWVLSQSLSLRLGHILMPMGPLNEFHEPTLFLSVERSQINTKLIPTTWNEMGVGLALAYPEQGLALRAFLVNGLKGSSIIAEKGTKGIRSARFGGKDILAEDIAGVARIEYSPLLSLSLGASAYFGGADHSSVEQQQLTVGLFSADVKYRMSGLQLLGQIGYGILNGSYFEKTLNIDGRNMLGYMVEADYFISDLGKSGSQIAPFLRYENINLDLDPAAAKAPDVGEQIFTGGLAYYPFPNLAFKVDISQWLSQNAKAYTAMSGEKGDSKTIINLGIGLMY